MTMIPRSLCRLTEGHYDCPEGTNLNRYQYTTEDVLSKKLQNISEIGGCLKKKKTLTHFYFPMVIINRGMFFSVKRDHIVQEGSKEGKSVHVESVQRR